MQLPFIVFMRPGVITGAGAVLNIKSYLLKSPDAMLYPLADAFAISSDFIVSTLTSALRQLNLSAITVPHLPYPVTRHWLDCIFILLAFIASHIAPSAVATAFCIAI